MKYLHTNLKSKLTFGASLVAFALAAGVSPAAIVLSLTDINGNPTVGQVEQGATFTVTVNLQSTLEQTTGITYFLQENAAGNPHLQITARNTTGSTYSVLTETDPGVLFSTPNSLLDPSNNVDLGAGVANLNSPNGIGTFFVADITLLVLPTTPVGTYTLGFTSNSVAAGVGPDFFEIPVTGLQYTVVATTVPEPGSVLLLTFGGLLACAGSRRRPGQAKLG